jgi:hypothetical protein
MEATQLMLTSEKQCNKFCDGSIEFSLVTSIWIRHLQAYHWVQQFHQNKVAHGGNLFRTCRHLNILSPLVLTPAQVLLNVNECMTWLEDLKKDAPRLRNVHLRECLSLALVREDTATVVLQSRRFFVGSQSVAAGGQCGRQQTQTGEGQSHGSQCFIQQVTHSMPQGRA